MAFIVFVGTLNLRQKRCILGLLYRSSGLKLSCLNYLNLLRLYGSPGGPGLICSLSVSASFQDCLYGGCMGKIV